MAGQAPPGWYRQPDGSQRWWDGRQWTEQTALAPQPPFQLPTRSGLSTGAILAIVFGGLGALILVVVALAAIGASSSGSPLAGVSSSPSRTTFATLTEREWAQIAKDPDGHRGDAIVVSGIVTQFDAATGTSEFLANVTALPDENGFSIGDNTSLIGNPAELSSLVRGDSFTANVIVVGSYTYDTQIGGQTTVPQLRVVSLTSRG